jgi:hypothetical protein
VVADRAACERHLERSRIHALARSRALAVELASKARAMRAARREAGVCARASCSSAALPDRPLCVLHTAEASARRRSPRGSGITMFVIPAQAHVLSSES